MAHVETLVAWLNDAYAMEQALVNVLGNQARDAKDHPEIRQRIEQHRERTRHHAERVKRCVESLGSSVSGAKSGIAQFLGAIGAMAGKAAEDAIVKDSLATCAIENFEIACYRALITAARELGEEDIVSTCEAILEEEREMAAWAETELPMVVHEYIARATVRH